MKTILITGCSSGIGYDAAETLRKKGWRVLATCRKKTDCQRLRHEGFETFVLDYSKEDSINFAVEYIKNYNNGKLDALFNNGAYALPGAVEDLTRDSLRKIFEVNFFGHVELMNKLLPSLKNSIDGRVINCSSVLGFAALPYRGAYNATKFAIEAITDTIRREETAKTIKFILLEPGPIRTKIRQNSIPHFEKSINWKNSDLVETYKTRIFERLYQSERELDFFEQKPDQVTKKLLSALNSKKPKKRYYVTYPTHVANIINRFLPTSLQDRLFK
jgi:NAD(P)-dependent dehydrogenase (short-subunit alcohol dehydrogenase family)